MTTQHLSRPATDVLTLAELAEKRGDDAYDIPDIFGNGAPISDPAFVKHLARELRKHLSGTPSKRRRDLEREAGKLERLEGWRATSPELARHLSVALRALAAEQPRRTKSGPKFGSMRTSWERQYVNKAFAELIPLALSRKRADWVAELFKRGGANRPSRGRALVAQRALALAQAEGVTLSRRKIPGQIHEYVRTADSPINFLAASAKRHMKQVRQSRPRLYDPWAE